MNILKYFWLRDSEEHFIPFYFTLMSWKCSKNWNYKSVQEILALLVGNTLDRESSWAGQDWRLETEHLCVSRPHWQWPALGGWMWWWWRVHWSGSGDTSPQHLEVQYAGFLLLHTTTQHFNTALQSRSIRHISTLNSNTLWWDPKDVKCVCAWQTLFLIIFTRQSFTRGYSLSRLIKEEF